MAEQASLSHTWAETPKIGFLVTWHNYGFIVSPQSLSSYLMIW